MTRLAVLADIHGNLPALEAVINDMAQFEVDHVVVAGDSVNVGPFSREVLETITERNWAVIRGNNAFYVLDYQTPRHARALVRASHCRPWLRAQLGRQVDELRLPACPIRYRCVSPTQRRFVSSMGYPIIPGSPSRRFQQRRDQVENAGSADTPEDTIIGAHSHIPLERHLGRWHIFNPGSVGIPLDGDRRASYMMLSTVQP